MVFKQKTAYEIGVRLVGSEMCIRDSMGEPSVGGGINQTPADQGVFGHPVQLMAPQQQEVFAPAPVQQPQGMIPPSIPQAGVRPGMPQMVSC